MHLIVYFLPSSSGMRSNFSIHGITPLSLVRGHRRFFSLVCLILKPFNFSSIRYLLKLRKRQFIGGLYPYHLWNILIACPFFELIEPGILSIQFPMILYYYAADRTYHLTETVLRIHSKTSESSCC
jgi:hypothetical protein